MPTPAQIKIAGKHVRDKNWGVITEAIERSCASQAPEFFDKYTLQMVWVVNPTSPPPSADVVFTTLLNLHNNERARLGLPGFSTNPSLTNLAQKHSEFMAKTGNFNHDEPGNSFKNRIDNSGLNYNAAGENIAVGYNTAEAVFDGWMKSPGHKANIQNANFELIGIGYATSSSGRMYWTTDFMRLRKTFQATASEIDLSLSLPGGILCVEQVTAISEAEIMVK